MGGPAGSVWDGNPDADLGSLYSFLDVQHMRGGRASSFLWKSDRISGRYTAAFGNLPVEKEKTAKNVCDIRTDDQQKMDPEKRASAFWHFDGFCDLDDVLRFPYERRHSVLRLFGIRRLCTPHGNDAIFFKGK